MEIFVNHIPYTFPESTYLIDVLIHFGLDHGRGLAIAVNDHIITRTQWEKTPIHAGDKLTLIRAVQGG